MSRHHTKKQANVIPPKDTNKVLVTYPSEMEIYELPEQEFKIIILWKLGEVQENTDI